MTLNARSDGGFEYQVEGRVLSVNQLLVDAAFTVEMTSPEVRPSASVSVRLGGAFKCWFGGDEKAFDPEHNRVGLGPALALWGSRLRELTISSDSSLLMVFQNGTRLAVPPDPDLEAWTLNDHEGLLVVGGPSDRVSVFRRRAEGTQRLG
ncbi:MAG TPA: DUF6188 family protein [Acidimicrobiales bacterium]|nr:DUF6188 family protein [Acidimicrobiales bacterium]